MGAIKELKEISIKKLKPYKKNAKKHSESQIKKIADSIKEVGFLNPCLIDKDMNVIAGHGRIEAAKLLEMETVPCIYVEGLSEEQRKAYIIADNRLTELGEWDFNILERELKELTELNFDIDFTGWNFESIDFMKHDNSEQNDGAEYSESISDGREINPDDYNDDTFECECPKCGFKFNR